MAKYLFDTCAFLWLISDQESRISVRAKEIYLNDSNVIYVSIISQIETTIKNSKQKGKFLKLPVLQYFADIRESYNIELLNLAQDDIDVLSKLPDIHNDPFDRLLIAQAMNNGMILVTPDEKIEKYSVRVEW